MSNESLDLRTAPGGEIPLSPIRANNPVSQLVQTRETARQNQDPKFGETIKQRPIVEEQAFISFGNSTSLASFDSIFDSMEDEESIG